MCRGRWGPGGQPRRVSATAPRHVGRGGGSAEAAPRLGYRRCSWAPASRCLAQAHRQRCRRSRCAAGGGGDLELPARPSRSGVSPAPTPPFSELGLGSWARFDALHRDLRGQDRAAKWFWAKPGAASCHLNPRSRGGCGCLSTLLLLRCSWVFFFLCPEAQLQLPAVRPPFLRTQQDCPHRSTASHHQSC